MATETLAETLISVRGPITKADHLHYFCNMGPSCFRPSCFPRKIVCIRTGFPSFRQESNLYGWHECDNTCLLLIPADSTVENRFFAVAPVGLADVKIRPPFPFHVLCKLYPSAVSDGQEGLRSLYARDDTITVEHDVMFTSCM